jgi:hypothetical protein
VERVLCGHLHRTIQTRWAGTIAMTIPSTAHAVALDVRHEVPLSLTLEPPGYGLHLWREGTLVSHLALPGEYERYTVGMPKRKPSSS